jgi:hypothetical protein
VPNYLIRVRLPDRPGALGAVASRIGSVGADVVSIDILERDPGVVVDELGVGLADGRLIDLLRDEILEVDGVVIESIRLLEGPVPDLYAELLDVATELFRQTSPSELLEHLVVRVRRSLAATFAVVLEPSSGTVVVSDGLLPDPAKLAAAARRATELPAGSLGAVPEGQGDPTADDARALAVAPLERTGSILLVRRSDPVLRDRERRWISVMAELAGHQRRELSELSDRGRS